MPQKVGLVYACFCLFRHLGHNSWYPKQSRILRLMLPKRVEADSSFVLQSFVCSLRLIMDISCIRMDQCPLLKGHGPLNDNTPKKSATTAAIALS